MDHGKSVCKWFAAIRGAADGAVEDLTAVFEPNDTQKRKADILLRQFLCDRLPARIMEVEGLDAERAEAVRRDVYSRAIEDALAGSGYSDDGIELAMFLRCCLDGVEDEAAFRARLAEALGDGTEAVTAASEQAREAAWAKLVAQTRKKEPRPERESRDDEPPPWLDEFEYIDWLITH